MSVLPFFSSMISLFYLEFDILSLALYHRRQREKLVEDAQIPLLIRRRGDDSHNNILVWLVGVCVDDSIRFAHFSILDSLRKRGG